MSLPPKNSEHQKRKKIEVIENEIELHFTRSEKKDYASETRWISETYTVLLVYIEHSEQQTFIDPWYSFAELFCTSIKMWLQMISVVE